MNLELTAVFRRVPEGYNAFVEEFPGTNTQGATLEEARANLKEAVELVLEANRTLAQEDASGSEVSRQMPEETVMSNSLEHLTVEAFQSRIGESFRIRPHPDTDVAAELIEARALGGGPARADAGASRRRMPFSLSFRTSLTTPLPQRIYEVAHDELGSYEIFLVPVGPDAAGMVYEAIFT
jgi:predicted RNase H-like HicB family nuclease